MLRVLHARMVGERAVTRFDDIQARHAAATPGPWERGDVWARAGVMPERFGEGRCAFCAKMGEPVWVGHDDINGTRMLAHKHHDPEPWGPDHLISGPDGLVAGNYDYEQGGIINAADAEFIAHCPDDVRWLLDRVKLLALGCEAALAHAEALRMDTPEEDAVRLKLVETLQLALYSDAVRAALDTGQT